MLDGTDEFSCSNCSNKHSCNPQRLWKLILKALKNDICGHGLTVTDVMQYIRKHHKVPLKDNILFAVVKVALKKGTKLEILNYNGQNGRFKIAHDFKHQGKFCQDLSCSFKRQKQLQHRVASRPVEYPVYQFDTFYDQPFKPFMDDNSNEKKVISRSVQTGLMKASTRSTQTKPLSEPRQESSKPKPKTPSKPKKQAQKIKKKKSKCRRHGPFPPPANLKPCPPPVT